MQVTHRRGRTARQSTTGGREGGYILAKFALLLVPLLLMTGLSVDVGYWYSRASDIQKAADAAALAGVVWLPDLDQAEQYATAAAQRNGFVDGQDGITIAITQAGDRRLRVTIRDASVGSFFFEHLGGSEIDLQREGLAEYVLPVPMGSPRNYFGTGSLLSGTDAELLYQSVNPACTSMVNGDRHQSLHYNPLASGSSSLSSCSSTPSNMDYRDEGYSLYIEAPAARTQNIDVMLYDPRYNDTDLSWQEETGEDCVTTTNYAPTLDKPSATTWQLFTSSTPTIILTGPMQYQTRTSSSSNTWSAVQQLPWGSYLTNVTPNLIRFRWGGTWTPSPPSTWSSQNVSNSITVNGPAVYQTRSSSTSTTWSNPVFLNAGQSYSLTGNRLRYRTVILPTSTTCTPTYTTYTENNLDTFRQSQQEDYTFSLYSADDTALDDSDNPPVSGCTKTYTYDSVLDVTYLGSRRWTKLCTITTSMPSGRYILQVQNEGTGSTNGADGSNQWGAVAKYQGASGNGLCDGRTDTLCPRVYGKDAISVYANTSSGVASFFLAEIAPEHNGKILELQLWDPGEGGSQIEFLRPTGTDTWTTNTFSWASYNSDGTATGSSNTNVSWLNVTNSVFNGKLVRIQIPLTNYDPPDDNNWWKIKYTFTSGTVTDRTTWTAKVVGDPVHLLEEEAA